MPLRNADTGSVTPGGTPQCQEGLRNAGRDSAAPGEAPQRRERLRSAGRGSAAPEGIPQPPRRPREPREPRELSSSLKQGANFCDDLVRHVDHQVVSAGKTLAADLRAALLPDRQHIVETAHRSALAP